MTYMYLHKTSHKSPKICTLSKNVKNVLFLFSLEQHFFGQDSFKIFGFFTFFFYIFQEYDGFLKVRFNDVEIRFFF